MGATTALRIQTVTNQINKLNLRQTLLAQRQQTFVAANSEMQQRFGKAYMLAYGKFYETTDEQKEAYKQYCTEVQQVLFTLNENENEIEIEINQMSTQLKALTAELEKLETLQQNEAKKGVVRF